MFQIRKKKTDPNKEEFVQLNGQVAEIVAQGNAELSFLEEEYNKQYINQEDEKAISTFRDYAKRYSQGIYRYAAKNDLEWYITHLESSKHRSIKSYKVSELGNRKRRYKERDLKRAKIKAQEEGYGDVRVVGREGPVGPMDREEDYIQLYHGQDGHDQIDRLIEKASKLKEMANTQPQEVYSVLADDLRQIKIELDGAYQIFNPSFRLAHGKSLDNAEDQDRALEEEARRTFLSGPNWVND